MIIETDIGNDPDDFFALCYLIAAGVKIDAILLVPGHQSQIAIVKFVLEQCGLDIPIGGSNPSGKLVNSGIHEQLISHYHKRDWWTTLGTIENSEDVLSNTVKEDTEFLILGPVTGIGSFFSYYQKPLNIATMQGGFLPYNLYSPSERLEKFENKVSVPTFNLNGDRLAADYFFKANIKRRMVGKNVCHTVVFNNERLKQIENISQHPAKTLFYHGMSLYLRKHDEKKFHDPLATVCHIHPEIGTWFKGSTVKHREGWSTMANPYNGDDILADIDRDLFWYHITSFT